MPTPQRQKLHFTLSEDMLPEVSTEHAGEFYVARAQGTVWFVASNGALVSLTDLLANAKPVAPPRAGKDGTDGKDGAKGERGAHGESGRDGVDGKPGKNGSDGVDGKPGRDGADGKDSFVAGPAGTDGRSIKGDKGDSIKGPKGDKGEKGDTGPAADITALKAQVGALQSTVDALLDQNKRSSEYIEFLQAKVAARTKGAA